MFDINNLRFKYYIKVTKKDGGFLIFEENSSELLLNRLDSYLLDNYDDIDFPECLKNATWQETYDYYAKELTTLGY